jgi:hypothetical protein
MNINHYQYTFFIAYWWASLSLAQGDASENPKGSIRGGKISLQE